MHGAVIKKNENAIFLILVFCNEVILVNICYEAYADCYILQRTFPTVNTLARELGWCHWHC
jgi:hypothetical protein